LIHVDDTSLAVTVGELGLQDYVASTRDSLLPAQ